MIFKQQRSTGSTGKVYQHLFEEIVYGRLKPGVALSEVEIAAALSISRTPVREALMKLESDGLVTRFPSRGCFVADITLHDVEEIFELRTQLEICALKNSYKLITAEELLNMRETLDSLSPDTPVTDYYDADRQLHSLVLHYCGNNRLIDFLSVLYAQIERVRVISSSKPHRLVNSKSEHLAIVDALIERDLPKAVELLGIHINNVRDSSIEVCKYMNMAHV